MRLSNSSFTFGKTVGAFLKSSKAKFLNVPLGVFVAISAASMGKVPEPQNGSINALSALKYEFKIIAAAIVSLIGAIQTLFLYPLLCKPSPDVSNPTVTASFKTAISILYSVPVSGNAANLKESSIFFTIAFFAML